MEVEERGGRGRRRWRRRNAFGNRWRRCEVNHGLNGGGTAAIVERSGIDAAALCVTKREEGKKDDRCFRGSVDTVEMLRAFLIMHFHENGIETRNIGLSTNSPMCDVRRTPRQ
jgi:hypothetical protein